MFIGHFGVGFAAKVAAPRVSLGSLFLAAQFADLLWPTLVLLGIERVRIEAGITAAVPLAFVYYPFSHSLAAAAVWGILMGLVYLFFQQYWKGAIVLSLVVLSHWLLDALAHRPDLPLYPGGHYLVGLGLWSSIWGTLVVELLLFATGVWLYLRATRPRDRTGRWALAGLIVFLILVCLGNTFGPPPPSTEAVAWVGQSTWLLVALGYWINWHRVPATASW